MHATAIEAALQATGELLAADGHAATLVVVGGAAMLARGIVDRATQDVDVVAFADRVPVTTLRPPEPWPEALTLAAATVSRDFNLPPDWLNAVVASQWRMGMPPTIGDDLLWRSYAGLTVAYIGRATLIAMKLFAATDRGPQSVHVADLIAITPTDAELEQASEWVRTQDASPSVTQMIAEVCAYVARHRR